MNAKQCILISGGLDSSVLAHHLVKEEQCQLFGVYINHGQPAARQEQDAVKNMGKTLGIPVEILDCSGLWSSFAKVAGPHIHMMTSGCGDPSAGIVLGAHYAGWAGAKTLYVGIHADNLRTRPWLSKMIDYYQSALNVIEPSIGGYPPGGDEFKGFRFEMPFARMTKAEIVLLGQKLNVDFERTRSCQANGAPCGKCHICRNRMDAFGKAGVTDSTKYARPGFSGPQGSGWRAPNRR